MVKINGVCGAYKDSTGETVHGIYQVEDSNGENVIVGTSANGDRYYGGIDHREPVFLSTHAKVTETLNGLIAADGAIEGYILVSGGMFLLYEDDVAKLIVDAEGEEPHEILLDDYVWEGEPLPQLADVLTVAAPLADNIVDKVINTGIAD